MCTTPNEQRRIEMPNRNEYGQQYGRHEDDRTHDDHPIHLLVHGILLVIRRSTRRATTAPAHVRAAARERL